MPQMPGTEVADALRARRPAIRVLFMSGYAASALATGRALTVDEAPLEKPFSAKCLLARVQGALAGARDVSPGPGGDISQG